MSDNRKLRALERKLDRLALAQLREVARQQAELIEELEQSLECAAARIEEDDRRIDMLQDALHDTDFHTHRSLGITKDGALLVVANTGVSA